MTLNTFVAGNPGSLRAMAESVRQLGSGVHENASSWHRVRGQAAGEWEGQASEAFQATASRNGRDADGLSEMHATFAEAVTVLADELDTVKIRMEQAKQVARDGELTVLADAILPPGPVKTPEPEPPQGRVPAAQAAAHSEAVAQFQAAQALRAKQDAAYAEARQTVDEARRIEHAAHDKLKAALDRHTEDLGHLGQAGEWAQATTLPTSAAGMALASTATGIENQAANATRSMFEQAVHGGPFATQSAWASMSEAQRGDLIGRYPQLVGSADGVPVAARSAANKKTLSDQRRKLIDKIRDAEHRQVLAVANNPKGSGENPLIEQEIEQLRDALQGLDSVSSQANRPDMYLLALDADANGRGQVALAHGNPDTAQNVLTTVPGTQADLGDATYYVNQGDTVMHRAQELAPDQTFSSITWTDYQAPKNLGLATTEYYADNATEGLSNFQHGLRASHEEGLPPSNNTVIGHSYGSTTVGYAARDHGLPVDNIGFIGSPGVGVDNAADLHVPPDHVWSGTAGLDIIDYATPSPNPIDHTLLGPDHHWFGMNPSDPAFGGRTIPTSPWAGHGGYWAHQESVDGMAKIVSGKTGEPPKP